MTRNTAWAGQRVVVTGAASGIGLAIAQGLAARGAQVVLADLAGAPLDDAARGCGGTAFACDVSDPGQVEALAAAAVAQLGGVDVVFANAGVIVNGPLVKATAAELDWVLGVNVRGAFTTMTAFARVFAGQDQGGRICVTASEHSLGLQHAGAGLYTASKHAVLGLAEVLRAELPAKIAISAFCPGLVATNLGATPRPAHLPEPRPHQRALGAAVQAQGMPAAQAADAAIDGVARGDFLIVPHAHSLAAAQRRFDEIALAFAQQAPRDDTADRYDVNRIVAEVVAARTAGDRE